MKERIHNFNAGPAALPLSVLEEIQAGFLNFKGSGMSIAEVSHQTKSAKSGTLVTKQETHSISRIMM